MADAPAGTRLRLLSLPQELQDNIQEYVFDDEYAISDDYRAPPLLRALRTNSNQDIFQRAQDTFYRTATFTVGSHGPVKWLLNRQQHAGLIRNLRHYVTGPRAKSVMETLALRNPRLLPKKMDDIPNWENVRTNANLAKRQNNPMFQPLFDDFYEATTKANSSRAQAIAEILAEHVSQMHAAGIDFQPSALKFSMQTANGHAVWTSDPVGALPLLLSQAGYDKKVEIKGPLGDVAADDGCSSDEEVDQALDDGEDL